MAMKGFHSNSQRQCKVDIEIGRMVTKDNTMLVENLAKYNALIGMPFMPRNNGIISCGKASIKFPNTKIIVGCEPASTLIPAAVSETINAELIVEFEDICPEIVLETLPPQ